MNRFIRTMIGLPGRLARGAPRNCVLLVVAGLGLAGCEDLSDFDTGATEAYCGQITLASSYRLGFSPRVRLKLQLDTSKVETGESPGRLWSYDAGDATSAPERLLYESPLRPIAPLSHDALSELEFGDGRTRNLIYAVTPSEAEAESLFAVLSFRTDGAVEVRLMRPGVETEAGGSVPAGRRALFGVFVLTRHEDLCGF